MMKSMRQMRSGLCWHACMHEPQHNDLYTRPLQSLLAYHYLQAQQAGKPARTNVASVASFIAFDRYCYSTTKFCRETRRGDSRPSTFDEEGLLRLLSCFYMCLC